MFYRSWEKETTELLQLPIQTLNQNCNRWVLNPINISDSFSKSAKFQFNCHPSPTYGRQRHTETLQRGRQGSPSPPWTSHGSGGWRWVEWASSDVLASLAVPLPSSPAPPMGGHSPPQAAQVFEPLPSLGREAHREH